MYIYLYIYILLTLRQTAARDTRERLANENHGWVTINHGQTTKQFKLSYRYYYFVGVPPEPVNSDIDWVIIRDERNFNSILGTWILGKFSFKFVDGVETYTTHFQLGAQSMWHKHKQVQEIKNLRIFQCTLTLYEFFAITASFYDREKVEFIESKIKTEDTRSFIFRSLLRFNNKVRYLTVRGEENKNENSGESLMKILKLLPKLTSLKVIDDSVDGFFEKMELMDKLKTLHIERVSITASGFFRILSKCGSLQELTIIGETLSGLGAEYTRLGYNREHDLIVNVDNTDMREEDFAVLEKLVKTVEVID